MNRIFKFAFSHLNGIKVYALVGRSGTGKSHHSKLVAQKHHIDLIIDDGLPPSSTTRSTVRRSRRPC